VTSQFEAVSEPEGESERVRLHRPHYRAREKIGGGEGRKGGMREASHPSYRFRLAQGLEEKKRKKGQKAFCVRTVYPFTMRWGKKKRGGKTGERVVSRWQRNRRKGGGGGLDKVFCAAMGLMGQNTNNEVRREGGEGGGASEGLAHCRPFRINKAGGQGVARRKKREQSVPFQSVGRIPPHPQFREDGKKGRNT